MAKKMNGLDWTATTLTITGGINWGLVGFFDFNLVEAIPGINMIPRIIYGAIGVASLFSGFKLLTK